MSLNFDFNSTAGRRAWIRELLAPMDDAKFDALARILFAWQYARVPAFARLCVAHGVSPKNLRSWRDIPAMPQQVFKLEKLYARGLGKPAAIYETSGTTTGQPGRQYLASTDIYRAVALANAARPPFWDREFLHFLVPSPKLAPHSSLTAMFGFWAQHFGTSRTRFWVKDNAIDFAALRTMLETQRKRGQAIGIAGTAFSFVHLLEAWADLPPLRLPRGSWLLETGGFKGRSREVSKPELYAQLARTFSRPRRRHLERIRHERALQPGLHAWRQRRPYHAAVGARARVSILPRAVKSPLGNAASCAGSISPTPIPSSLCRRSISPSARHRASASSAAWPRTEPRGCSLSAEDTLHPASTP